MRKYLLTSILSLLAGCSDSSTAILSESLPLEANVSPLFSTQYSNIREPRRMIISDEETWARLWAEMLPSASGPATPPFVDFRTENVVVAAMGERRGAGFAIQIVDVERAHAALRIGVTSTLPTASCSGSDVISTPLDAVRIPKSAANVQFTERSIVLTCS